MTTKSALYPILLVLLFACSGDDGTAPGTGQPNSPDDENHAPEDFTLLQVADDSLNVPPVPELNWEEAPDPDGDAVVYDIFLGTETDPVTRIAEGITDNSFTIPGEMALSPSREYFWKVVAKDGRGGETSSGIFGFKVRSLSDAQQMITTNPFLGRDRHASAVLDGMWVLGGFDDNGASNDAWHSTDGASWTVKNLNSTTNYTERFFHEVIAYDDKLWIVGGVASNFSNDVWSSADGADWNSVDQLSEFTVRAEFSLTEFNGKLWVIGGSTTGGEKLGDVWSSADGASWEQIGGEEAAFGKRNFHQTVAFDGKLWVIGGFDANSEAQNDVWSSPDGENWERVLESAPFSARAGHKCLVFDDKIWLIGSGNNNDIWYSGDGQEWIDATPENSFPAKDGFTALFYQNRIWILGGSVSNEVWFVDYQEFTN